jgi:hypothetical protein
MFCKLVSICFYTFQNKKVSQKAHHPNLGFFFGGTCATTKVGACVKTTISPKVPYFKVQSLFQKLQEMGSLL